MVKQSCDELQLPIISVVGVSVGLIDFNPSVQKFHLERCKRYLDMGVTLGAKNYLLVIGEYIWQKEVIPPAEQWQWAVEHCQTLGDYAAERDLEIVIELEPFDLSLINTIGEMDRFLTDVDRPAVKANIDISHMVLSNSPPESLATLKGRAGHVHISDCDGEVHGDLPPGRGVVPFVPYLQAIKDLDFAGAISLELGIRARPRTRSSNGSPRPTPPRTNSWPKWICEINDDRKLATTIPRTIFHRRETLRSGTA